VMDKVCLSVGRARGCSARRPSTDPRAGAL